jgi:LacI family transcriptional regulator
MNANNYTMDDVARRANVSKTTVSHVINKTRYVSEKLRTRVLSVMNEMGYEPNILARSLRRNETCTIGLIVPNNANPFYAEVAWGVESLTFEAGYNTILCNSDRNLEKEIRYIDLLMKKRADGILFVGAWAGEQTEHLHKIFKRGVPLVAVDRYVPGLEIDTVVVNNTLGGWLATMHLAGLGHRRIACIGGIPLYTPNADRVKGYCKALAETGLPFYDEYLIRSDFQYEGGYSAAQRLLALKDPPTAIFACNDLLAIGAMRAALDLGLRVPESVSIVGFDDIRIASFTNPPLTTVAQPMYKMGQRGAEILLERIRESGLPVKHEVWQPELIVRGSTARCCKNPQQESPTITNN